MAGGRGVKLADKLSDSARDVAVRSVVDEKVRAVFFQLCSSRSGRLRWQLPVRIGASEDATGQVERVHRGIRWRRYACDIEAKSAVFQC